MVIIEIIVGLRSYYILIHSLRNFMQGIIKKLTDKNFGFITPEGGDQDLFFHANELDGIDFSELREGDAVTFEVTDTPKGKAATKVSKV